MAENVLSFEEVSKHNKSGDCWLLIHGKVYNVSPFLEEHPGGDEVMLNVTGKDATDDFEDIGHSSYAEGLMKDFLIGKIDDSTLPKIVENAAHHQPTVIKESSDTRSSILLYLLPLLILGVAFLLRFYSKSQ